MKKLKVDWSMLELAFDDSSWEHSHYLDLETGQVILVTADEHVWFGIDRQRILTYAAQPTFSTPTSYVNDVDLKA